MENVIKKIIIFYIFILQNVFSNICFDNMSYIEGTTCDVVKPLTQNHPEIIDLNNSRRKEISSEIGMLVFEKLERHHEELGKLEFLSREVGSGDLPAVGQCEIGSLLSSHSCGDEISKEVFSAINDKSGLDISSSKDMEAHMRNKFISQYSPDINNDPLSCSNPAILNRKGFENLKNYSQDDAADFLNTIISISNDTQNANASDNTYSRIKLIYPDFWKDLHSQVINLPESIDQSNGINGVLKSILSDEGNQKRIKEKIDKNCSDIKTLLNEVQCKPVNTGRLTNNYLSNILYEFTTEDQISSFSSEKSDGNFENPEESFKHFAVNCLGKGCEDDSCLDVDLLFERDDGIEPLLGDYEKLHDDIRGLKRNENLNSTEDTRVLQTDCIKMNCSNYEEVIANNSLECTSRESREVAMLQTEFSCNEPSNEHASVCQTLEIVHVSKSRPRRSAFVDSILGTTSDPRETPAVVENVELGSGEPEAELDTAYDRGEREQVVSRSRNLANNNSSRESSPSNSAPAARKSRRRTRAASATSTATLGERAIFNNQNTNVAQGTDGDFVSAEEEYTDDEVGMIESLRNSITGAFDSIGNIAQRAVAPRSAINRPSNPRSRIGERRDTSSSHNDVVSGGDYEFRDAFDSGSFDDVVPVSGPVSSNVQASSGRSRSIGSGGLNRNLLSAGGRGAAGAVAPGEARNIGYMDDNQGNLIPSIVLNANDLATLDEDQIRKLEISPDRPFLILVDVGNGQKVSVRVTRDNDGLVPHLGAEDTEHIDKLRSAPIFANYFNREVRRVHALDSILENR